MPDDTFSLGVEMFVEVYFAFENVVVDSHRVRVMERINANNEFIDEYP